MKCNDWSTIRTTNIVSTLDLAAVIQFGRWLAIRMIRAFSLGFVVVVAAGSVAFACLGGGQDRVIFLTKGDLASGIVAPAIFEVEIIDFFNENSADIWVEKFFVVVARIDKVIKGSVDRQVIKILLRPTTCGIRGIKQGARGVVAGTLERDAQGLLKLMAITTTVDQQRR